MVISVSLGAKSYPITVESGALAQASRELSLDRRVLVVTDSGVPQEYAQAIASRCRQSRICTLPAGEGSKSMDSYHLLLREMLRLHMDRGDCVAAVGGGMVGDLAGFAAACFMRGVDFYNLPTTLLSQVDSSIGGKTGVNLDGVKNIVGAFWQPRGVLIDPDTLMPANYYSAVSVLAPDSGLADCLSTGLYCMPLEEGQALVESLENVEAMWMMNEENEVVYSSGFEAHLKQAS